MIKVAVKKILILNLSLLGGAFAYADLAYIAYTKEYWQVWLYDVSTNQSRQVSFSHYDKNVVSWFPANPETGKRDLLINTVNGDVYRLNIETGKETEIQLKRRGFFDAKLSPNGEQITFSYSATGETDDSAIWIMSLSTKNMKKLTNMKGLQHNPYWSEDGESIYFAANASDSTNGLWKVDLNGNKTQLVNNRYRNFDILPHSLKKVVNDSKAMPLNESYWYSNNASGNYDIWLKQAGKEAINITNHSALDKQPALSSNQTQLVFTSTRNGNVPNLWLYNTETKIFQQLTEHKRGARNAIWY